MWIDDAELIAVLATLAGACVIVTKQGRKSYKLKKLADLERVNERTPGLPVRAFSTFTGLAPRVDGKPMLVGPYGPLFDEPVPTIRTLGFRKTGKASGEKPPPILHAKLALLGNLWWHDEADWGPEDVMGFEGKRLWVSSANFTSSSRRSIELGYWTENPPLVQAAERFLVKLMRSIEGLDPDADSFDPDLVDVDHDDQTSTTTTKRRPRRPSDEGGLGRIASRRIRRGRDSLRHDPRLAARRRRAPPIICSRCTSARRWGLRRLRRSWGFVAREHAPRFVRSTSATNRGSQRMPVLDTITSAGH